MSPIKGVRRSGPLIPQLPEGGKRGSCIGPLFLLTGSSAVHARFEPGKGLTEGIVAEATALRAGRRGCNAPRAALCGVGPGEGGRRSRLYGGLDKAQARNGAVSEEGIDPLDDLARAVFHIQGPGGIDAQVERRTWAGGRVLGVRFNRVAGGPRPAHAFWNRVSGEVLARDPRPVHDQGGSRKTKFFE